MSGGDFQLTGGFWFETTSGDCNAIGVAGLFDMADFVTCMSDPHEAIAPSCVCFDVNNTSAIDRADFAEMQTSFLGE